MTKPRMNACFFACVLVFGFLIINGTPAGTQGAGAKNTSKDLTPRGLFISKSADAMRVKVLDDKNGVAVSPSRQFSEDDLLKVVIESNFESYAYIVNVETSKSGEKRFLLYPNPRVANNRIKPDEPLELKVSFDDKPAIEDLQVIVSHDRIDYLDAALKGQCSDAENRCQLDDETSTRVIAIVGGKKFGPQTAQAGIFPRKADAKPNASGLHSRDIILAPGKDKNTKETYVAIPIKAGDTGRLKPQETFVFELRLKHV